MADKKDDKKDPAAEKAAAIAKAEADFQADLKKAIEKRDAVLAKYPSDNIAEAAFNAIKGDDDLPFAQCSPQVREKLEYQASEAVKTGVSGNDFEAKAIELAAKAKKAAA
jgi:hypothetical protein